jgi:hypothetical protein
MGTELSAAQDLGLTRQREVVQQVIPENCGHLNLDADTREWEDSTYLSSSAFCLQFQRPCRQLSRAHR